MSLLFAATYPERARALILYGCYARHPTLTGEVLKQNIELIDRAWGTGEFFAKTFVPAKASDEALRRVLARRERQSASPSAAIAILQINSEIDTRHILPTIRVPTLVLHRVGDSRVTVDAGRYLAAQIPRAKYVELPGVNHIPLDITDRIADEIEEFLTGSRAEVEGDRVLATVMFTDIADSTRRAADLGDRSWRAFLVRHDDVVRQQLARFRGREIKTLGDGFLATFDGPARAVRCASAIIEQVGSLGIDVRSGLHTGEIEIQQGDVVGIAVNIAARIAELAGSREVLVSSTVRDLVAGSSLRFHDRGSHRLRGLTEPLRLFGAEA